MKKLRFGGLALWGSCQVGVSPCGVLRYRGVAVWGSLSVGEL